MSRRTTLGPLDAHLNAQKGRPSLAPRHSLAPRASAAALVKEDPRMSTGLRRTSIAQRRSSTYGRASLAPGAATIGKDPRNVRDKQWQFNAVRTLIKFLVEAGYPHEISQKVLTSPTGKDFKMIFQFLYSRLDEGYEWKPTKKFDEEVPILLRAIKYPYADSVTKSTLQAVGSLHAWPTLLAVLVWMVELIMALDQIENEAEFNEALDQQPSRMFHAALVPMYFEFLDGADVEEAMRAHLHDIFRAKDEQTMNEVERLKQDCAALEQELEKLKKEPSRLVKLDEEKKSLHADIEKVIKWTETLSMKQGQVAEQIAMLKHDVAGKEKEFEEASAERAKLQEIVDAQEISPADVDRMNSEREQLTKNLEQFTTKNDEVSKTIWEREIECQKKLDEVEKLAEMFNTKAYNLELIPADAENAHGINFEIMLEPNAPRPDKMVSIDLRGPVKHALAKLRSSFKTEALQCDDKYLVVKESLDRLADSVAEKLDDLNAIESRIRSILDQYETEKETSAAELQAKASEIETMERELRRLKVEGAKGLADSQKTSRELSIEYESLVRRTGEHKERIVKDILKALEEMVEFKAHVERQVMELKEGLVKELNQVREMDVGKEFPEDKVVGELCKEVMSLAV